MMQILHHFFLMDGYAAYIWPAYGVAALSLIGITHFTCRSLRKTRREAATLNADVTSGT